MLSSTTCVGLRYGRCAPDVSAAFPGSRFDALSPLPEGIGVLSPEGFNVEFRLDAASPLLRPRFTARTGAGMLTRFPSASPFGLSLGPGLP